MKRAISCRRNSWKPILILAWPVGDVLALITVRSNDQFNTTIYGMSDRLRGIEGSRKIVMMGPEGMAAEGLSGGDEITLRGDWTDGVERRVTGLSVVPYDLPPSSLAGYFPELNPVSPLSRHDLMSKTPAAKAIPVRISR